MFRIKIALLLLSLSGVKSNLCQPKDKIAYIRISEFTLSADDSDEVIDMNPPLPLTPTCRLYCNKAENCTGFSIDYTRNKCIIYNREILLTKLMKNRQSSIFNKTCLSPDLELPKICRRKGWQADLWQGWTLKDDKQQVTNLSTLEDCTVACFTNSSCGSVSFRNGSCTFHQKSSRRSITNIQAEKNSVLVDNWCHEDSLNSCAFSAWSGLVLLNSDVSVALSSAKECEKACSGSEDIPCWTYTYNETSQICNLSADNNMLIPDESSDSVYGERECMSHGRWTREGVCTCDINTGSNQKENIFGRFATFVHSVGKAVYDAVDPGHAPETACQCLEKPINGGSSGGEGESGGKTEESGGETGGATGGAGGEEHGETGGAGGEEHGGTGGAGGEEHGETGGAGSEHGGTGGAGGEEHGETGGAGGEEHGETGGATGETGNNNEGHGEGEAEHLPAQGEGAGPIIVNYPVNGGLVAPSNGLPPNQNSLYGGYQNPQQPPYNPYNPYNYGGTYNPYYTPQGRDRREFLPLFRRFK